MSLRKLIDQRLSEMKREGTLASEVAARIGIAPQRLSSWRHRETVPIEHFDAVARELDLDLAEMLEAMDPEEISQAALHLVGEKRLAAVVRRLALLSPEQQADLLGEWLAPSSHLE